MIFFLIDYNELLDIWEYGVVEIFIEEELNMLEVE